MASSKFPTKRQKKTFSQCSFKMLFCDYSAKKNNIGGGIFSLQITAYLIDGQ